MGHADNTDPDFDALAAFADDRLSPSERAQAAEHLVSCARCRTIVAELVRSRNAAPRQASWSRVLPLAASLAVVVAGGVYLISGNRAPEPAAPPVSAPPSPSQPPPAAPDIPSPLVTPSPATTLPASPAPPDRTRAAGTRTVDGREFRLVAGEWIDAGYRISDLLPAIDIQSTKELAKFPALNAFRELAPRFTVVIDGTVYRVSLPAANP